MKWGTRAGRWCPTQVEYDQGRNGDEPEGGDVRGLVWITTRITRSGELAPRRAWLLRYLHFDSCFAHLRPQGSPSQPVAMMTRHLERWCLPALRVCQVSSFLLLVIFMTKERIDVDIYPGDNFRTFMEMH